MEKSGKEEFRLYLIEQGYKENTLRGGIGETVRWLEKICEWERLTWEELEKRLQTLLRKYVGENGRFVKSSQVRALKRLEAFLLYQNESKS